ncbi:MAG: hypothetical protein R3A12_08270 [Ignavibacteria bacterium]
MATFYVKEVMSMQPEGPYLLGGRCFGGRVIYMKWDSNYADSDRKFALLAIFDTRAAAHCKAQNEPPEKRCWTLSLTSAFRHLRSGELFKVVKRFTSTNM